MRLLPSSLGLLLAGSMLAPTPVTAAPAPGAPASVTAAGAAASGAPTAAGAAAADERIRQVLRVRTRSNVLGKRFTMTVWDPATGSHVFKRRSKRSLRGASTTKVLTAVGALHALGPAHRFPTTVRAGATQDEVVLVAGGDPLLRSADLRRLAADTARALGLPGKASGGPADPAIVVRADDALFAGSPRAAGWRSSYLPDEVRPVGAFARDDNQAWDSTADAGAYFARALRRLGVQARYAGPARAAADAAALARFDGHSVAEAVSRMLLESDNDTAEMLFRQVALGRGERATWKGARAALRSILSELGVPQRKVRIIDGSGLSLKGRVTARALTAALARALSPDHPRLAGIRGWLPVAGRTGTLRASYLRFHAAPASCAAGLVQGKTGTLADAISLAGYAPTADGRTTVFVAIVNDRPTQYSRLQTRWAVDRAVSSITGCW